MTDTETASCAPAKDHPETTIGSLATLPRILSLSLVYPNPQEPGLGLFVRSRLQRLGELTDVRVVAPLALVDYSNPKRRLTPGRSFDFIRQDGAVRVWHPFWLYPPGGTPANVAALAVRLLPLLVRLRRERPFDLIDAHFGYPEGVVAALLSHWLGIPFIITFRGSETLFSRYSARRKAMRWALRRASRVITVSTELSELAVTLGAPAARVRKIPNGVDRAVFHPRDRNDCRARHGIALDSQVILSVGELIEAKGHHDILSVLDVLRQSHPRVELLVAGGVSRGGARFDKEIRDLISALGVNGRVRLLGWVDRAPLAELVCASDVMCLASHTEGWPNVVNESLSCGVPVVATRVGAVPEMIPSEDYGRVVPPRDRTALRNALDTALRTTWDRERIAAWGQTRSWESVASEVLREMSEVLEENTRD